MARTTVANTIERIRRQLASGQREEVNILNGAHSATTPVISFLFDLPAGLRPGAIVCVGTETMRVMETKPGDKTATVVRGWQDSEPEAHADKAEVWVNPRFQPMDIFEAIRDEIASWGPELYHVDGAEISASNDKALYPLPTKFAGCYGIIEARQLSEGPRDVWPRVPFRIQRGAGTSWSGAPSSGVALRFTEGVCAGKVYVLAAMPFEVDELEPDDDLVDNIGLERSMLDVVDKGVQFRMLIEAENSRGARTAQDEPRNTAETPWGAGLQSLQLVNTIYRRRKTEEAMKLAARYPFTGV